MDWVVQIGLVELALGGLLGLGDGDPRGQAASG